MANVKTAISLQQSPFDRVDALARELTISRSRLFTIAVEEFIQRYENQKLLEASHETKRHRAGFEENSKMGVSYCLADHDLLFYI